jgi:pimeloyl-ACP methyl ester carboxylesterase
MRLLSEKQLHRHLGPQLLLWFTGAVLSTLLLLTGIGAIYQALAAVGDKRRYPALGRLIDVGGHRVHALWSGAGSPTVILDAGLSGSALDWSLVQPEVATFTRVCAYDRAGAGWSDLGPKPRTSHQIVRELHALLTKAGLPPPYVLVGHSFGGLNMRLYACQHPEQVVGMVLVDAAPLDQRTRLPQPAFKERLIQQVQWQLFRLRPFLARLGLLRLLGKANGAVEGLPPALVPMARALGLRSKAYDWIFGEGQALQESEAQVRVAPAFPPVPLIVLSAGGDWPNPAMKQGWLTLQAELAQLSPHGQHRIVEQSGHFIQLDHPQLVIEAIRDVVMQVRAETGVPSE